MQHVSRYAQCIVMVCDRVGRGCGVALCDVVLCCVVRCDVGKIVCRDCACFGELCATVWRSLQENCTASCSSVHVLQTTCTVLYAQIEVVQIYK